MEMEMTWHTAHSPKKCLKRKSKVEGTTLSDFKIHYQVTINLKNHCGTSNNTDKQITGTKQESKNRPTHTSTEFWKNYKGDSMVKQGKLFQQMVLEQQDIHVQKNKLQSISQTIFTKLTKEGSQTKI